MKPMLTCLFTALFVTQGFASGILHYNLVPKDFAETEKLIHITTNRGRVSFQSCHMKNEDTQICKVIGDPFGYEFSEMSTLKNRYKILSGGSTVIQLLIAWELFYVVTGDVAASYATYKARQMSYENGLPWALQAGALGLASSSGAVYAGFKLLAHSTDYLIPFLLYDMSEVYDLNQHYIEMNETDIIPRKSYFLIESVRTAFDLPSDLSYQTLERRISEDLKDLRFGTEGM